MKVGSWAIVGFTLAIALAVCTSQTMAQTTVYSFESGVDGWHVASGNSGSVASSTVGPTDGLKSLQFTKPAGFSYFEDSFPGPTWMALLPTGDSISFDVTLDAGSNPLNGTFLAARIALNGDGAFQESNETQPDVVIPTAVGKTTVTFSLDFWDQPSTWTYQGMALALNTDAPMLVYIDNIRVNPAVPEPTTLVMCGLGIVGCALGVRRKK